MVDIQLLKVQLLGTFQSMKDEGLVNDHFTFVYSLKENNGDPFYLDVIPEFCCDVRDTFKVLAHIMMSDQALNYNLTKEHIYKVKGSSSSIGACGMALAFADFDRAIDTASKEECLMALNGAQRAYSALEEKLHICLQLERRIVLAAQGKN